MYKRIGVIASLPAELYALKDHMRLTGEIDKAELRFTEGTIAEKQVM